MARNASQPQETQSLHQAVATDLLNSQQQQAEANAPNAMSVLSSMLDRNNDGNSMDDLQRMAASFFK